MPQSPASTSLSADLSKLTAFHHTTAALNNTLRQAARDFGQQIAQTPPDYVSLADAIRLLRSSFAEAEHNARTACSALHHPEASVQMAACLERFQHQQDLRHYAVACAAEAIEAAQSLSAGFTFRYQIALEEADRLTPKTTAALRAVYATLGVEDGTIDLNRVD